MSLADRELPMLICLSGYVMFIATIQMFEELSSIALRSKYRSGSGITLYLHVEYTIKFLITT